MTEIATAIESPSRPGKRPGGPGALLACAALLAGYALAAWLAVRNESATFDEPMHGLGAWVNLWRGDFRIGHEHPPLWKYYLGLANGPHALAADFNDPAWRGMADDSRLKWAWSTDTLYRTAGNDPIRFIARERAAMLAIAMLLGAMTAWWAWELAGPVAAVIAAFLFALDPNFLAHGPIVKNDVLLSLELLVLAYLVWRAGQRLTVALGAGIALVCAAAVVTKFSGLIFGPLAVVLLLVRALGRAPWGALGVTMPSRGPKVVVVFGVALGMVLIGYGVVWASYRFRFAPSPDAGVRINTAAYAGEIARKEGERSGRPTRDVAVRALLWCERKHVLPQAFVAGLLYTRILSLGNPAYLAGRIRTDGWWYYFPFAAAVKTPVATMAAALLATLIVVVRARRRQLLDTPRRRWTAVCFAGPVAAYGLVLLTTRLDMGLRYALPIYPFAFVVIAAALAKVWDRARANRIGIAAVCLLGVGLAVETYRAFPHFVPFFNAAAGGWRGGLELLGDSNLDWGQDLPLLAEWQRRNGGRRLYLCYFGRADPAYYGIRYTNLPGGYRFGPPMTDPDPREGGVVAVSATQLQGIYLGPDLRDFYAPYRHAKPLEVLGGSIYLFEFPPR